jgi:hypothetical protein
MARGSYWQLHNFFHPEVLQLKRQQQLLQQQLQHALEELRGSISTVELLNARVITGNLHRRVISGTELCCR